MRRQLVYSTMAALVLAWLAGGDWAQAQAPAQVPPPGQAQNLQRIVAVVNDDVISARDVERRVDLMLASGIPDTGDARRRLREQALRALVDERLQMQEASRRNMSVAEGEIDRALRAIERQNQIPAGRLDDFLRDRGADSESLIAQIRAELAWARLIRARLMPTITIAEDEIDTTIQRIRASASLGEDLLSEIFLAVDNPEQEEEVRRGAQRLLDQLRAGANFAAIARQFSQGVTAAAGGEIGWVQPGTLPEETDAVVRRLAKGEVSPPIRSAGGFYLIALLDRRRLASNDPADTKLTLKQIVLPLPASANDAEVTSQTALANSIAGKLRGCENVEAIAKEINSPNSGSLGTVRLGDLQPALRQAVAKLAAGAISAPFRTGAGLLLLAVCDRVEPQAPEISRDLVRQNLMERRATMLSRRYLRDLRRDAVVEFR